MRNNIIYNGVIDGGQGKPSSGITYTSNQEYANPLLTDAGNKDFTLTSSSPAIDAGWDVSAYLDDDYFGGSRPQGTAFDIGAHEYPGSGGGGTVAAPTNLRISEP